VNTSERTAQDLYPRAFDQNFIWTQPKLHKLSQITSGFRSYDMDTRTEHTLSHDPIMSDMLATQLNTDERNLNLSYWQFGLVVRQARRHVALARATLMVNDALQRLLSDIHVEWGKLGSKLVEREIWSDIQARRVLLPLSLRYHYDKLDRLYEQLQEETVNI
jgi:hypothetical protein